jgi:hypothetical protein
VQQFAARIAAQVCPAGDVQSQAGHGCRGPDLVLPLRTLGDLPGLGMLTLEWDSTGWEAPTTVLKEVGVVALGAANVGKASRCRHHNG